ncbi:hypothetical protein SESBI_39563 [Sesbania bispinosa]|nr:hypothetical protein SESBI_39563 [Sesbania bispinosa]
MAGLHIRCNSLPSPPHPLLSSYEEHLRRLKDSEATSSISVSHKLNGLLDLHDCTDELLQLPIKQQALARECSDKYVDEILEGSLRLLETVHELQSLLRRRKCDETAFKIEAAKYLASRKKLKKEIRKALGNLKGIKIEYVAFPSNKDNDTSSMLSILREAEEVTVRSLESLLLVICNPKGQSRQNRWLAILKLMQPKRVASDSQQSNTNEFEKVDAVLQSLISHNPSSVKAIWIIWRCAFKI